MNLQYRIGLLTRLGKYILANEEEWVEAKHKASLENGWFLPEFIDKASKIIATHFLDESILQQWNSRYDLPNENNQPRKVGIVMAGNIPMVGFHDFLCVFANGHKAVIKTSSRDDTLIRHLVSTLKDWEPQLESLVTFEPLLRGCDAYIATGSNNTAGYFDYYFGKYPNIIRRNRTSVAILNGNESTKELTALADDVFLYFGLGCRNVTKLYIPENYDFVPLLDAFRGYDWMGDHHKYKNNYDYNLAIHLLNRKNYMSTPGIILIEDESFFSPISQLNYAYYTDRDKLSANLTDHPSIQGIVGTGFIPFGKSQEPAIDSYADGIDTMQFLSRL
jgi:hypothetical protein